MGQSQKKVKMNYIFLNDNENSTYKIYKIVLREIYSTVYIY